MEPNQQNYIEPFINYLQFEKRYSPHTVLSYTTDLTIFFHYLKTTYDSPALAEIHQQYIRSWLAWLKEGDKKNNIAPLQAKSIARKISSLRSFFKYYIKTGVLKATPMTNISLPKIGKRLPVFIKENETRQLLQTTAVATEDWKSLNAKMLLFIFYNTGMRLSELVNLKERQIDIDRHQVKILGKGNKERVIPIAPELLKEIEDYIRQKRKEFTNLPEELLVTDKGKKLYPKYAYLLVKTQLNTAATLDKKSPHILRHTFATHLMNNGADLNAVKELLGHSSLASTQVYTHNTIEKLKEVHRKAHPSA